MHHQQEEHRDQIPESIHRCFGARRQGLRNPRWPRWRRRAERVRRWTLAPQGPTFVATLDPASASGIDARRLGVERDIDWEFRHHAPTPAHW